MNDVAIVLLIHHHTRRWRRRQRELDAALQAVAARLHPRLHHAFADGLVVEVAGDVADGVIHDYDFGLWALGSGLWALGFGLWALGLGSGLSALGYSLLALGGYAGIADSIGYAM